jgi:CheY-like chemotaxis protein
MPPLPMPRVLVVEDDVVLAMRIAELLEDMGSTPVGPAISVVTALPIALHEQLDAALLDVSLIDQSVEPVAEVLDRRGVPFAVVTARSRDHLPQSLRVRPYIEKPFTDRQLRATAAFLLNPV